MRLSLFSLLVLSRLVFADIDLVAFEKELKGKGVEGEVHGATEALGLYVFVYRSPDNFFDHAVFPLITKLDPIQEELKKLGRHDRIKIKGKFAGGQTPIHHIELNDLTVVKKFEGQLPVPPYKHEAKLPRDLMNKTSFMGKVHAIVNGGKILVAEYKDAVVPVYVEKTELLKNLYRNDKVEIHYAIRTNPGRPVHIELAKDVAEPLKVLDRMVAIHGKEGSLEGNLVLFPKSPQVLFNVFALHQVDENGIERQYTLLNMEDPAVFEKIRNKLQEAWDSKQGNIKNIRNKYINLDVRVKATGTFNVIDPEQANPQILLTGPEKITILQTNAAP